MESNSSGRKRRYEEVEDGEEEVRKVYKFRVLLPNGLSVGLTLEQLNDQMTVEKFLEHVRIEYVRNLTDSRDETVKKKSKRKIDWMYERLYLQDVVDDYKWRDRIFFGRYEQKQWILLRLNDGTENPANKFENMWDVTPNTSKLPDSYTFLTALADLIDNSLQAVWSNNGNERRMISVVVKDDAILIADTGPGMDGVGENSIAKWGKTGLALHSSSRRQAIGGKPPYLKPFFGMFGYGGPVASMRLGRHTIVSSKMKNSNKVYVLHIKREALLHSSSGKSWKISGGLRDPLDDELSSSPHGSFTKVEILQPERTPINVFRLQCRLKDIYFPYIQYDELMTGKTRRPVEFQVNGEDLAEIEGGEVAITNLHSCNGPEFVLQLHFSYESGGTSRSPGSRLVEANARLKFVYFPVREGKESIDRILEKLEADKCGISENFDTFCRVSIRRLGRLLPDARWPRLPFMDLEHRTGDKAELLRRCSLRVKCLVDTDAGFNPTPPKNDLAPQHRFTTALKNVGCKLLEKDGIKLEIHRDQKALSLLQLEEEYEKWVLQMHDAYDQELGCGQDHPVLVVNPANKKGLGISSDVIRVHKFIKRKGQSWKAGNFIKIIPRDKQEKIYATLEFILLEGFEGDAGGEARLICRPIEVPAEKGCLLKVDDKSSYLDVKRSLSFPVNVIDSGECSKMDPAEWNHQLGRLQLKAPSKIDLHSPQHRQQPKIDGICTDSSEIKCQKTSLVKSRNNASQWRLSDEISLSSCNLRVGSYFPPLFIECYDEHDNHIQFPSIPELEVAVTSRSCRQGTMIIHVDNPKVKFINKRMVLQVSDILIEGGDLDKIRPEYEASLGISCSHDKLLSVTIPFTVHPGSLHHVEAFIPDLGKELLPGDVIEKVLLEMYDSYGNHVQEGIEVILNVKGFCFQDNAGPKRKVDAEGSIILNGILKVTGSYGETALFSVEHEEQLLFEKEVQIGRRELRLLSTLPGNCVAGSRLDSLMFGVVRSDGTVDETIHDDFLSNRSHTLILRSASSVLDDIEYTFQQGMCLVASIFVPLEPGIFSFEAAHSCNPELVVLVKVNVVQTPTMEVNLAEHEDVPFESPNGRMVHSQEEFVSASLTAEHEDVPFQSPNGRMVHSQEESASASLMAEHKDVQFQSPNGRMVPSQEESASALLMAEHKDVQFQSPNGRMVPSQEESASVLLNYNLSDVKELRSDVERIRTFIGEQGKNLEALKEKKTCIVQEISELQDLFEHETTSQSGNFVTDKEVIISQIKKNNTAASVLCTLPPRLQSMLPGIVGIVALLGSVNTDSLSRMLAEYLGEDLMLAVVCKSSANARRLENYKKSGEIDPAGGLHLLAAELGSTIDCGFLAICLEDLCPYSGESKSNDPQKKLDLIDPPGETPSGFLGYAVNMVNIDIQHLHTKTSKGYDLRQTLFYNLFGEVQVYGTRKQMYQAHGYIKEGAISLDGGIIKGRGVVALGPQKEPNVRFPVVNFESHQQQIDPGIAKKLEEKKLELGEMSVELAKVSKELDKAKKQVGKKMKRLTRRCEELEPFTELLPGDEAKKLARQLF
ncbi:structural maintenance of chromosomes flexible hinge domain-containing protein GMI1-like [Papaver somniferum]|uniref:structural maintenance of chromosomes flexible hinge domain-containing protein GMI1-like n=1 Tax=Papaver somniferum TaxID=3469 RepID=UPI000E7007C8|nr:structural maintenance of chromosomes flexible hinge domain-containing protein GMI1-like [Papaver somniferum]